MLDDTIAAIATPLGEGGIGIIRISGEETLKILKKVFISHSKNNAQKNNPPTFENRKLLYGNIIDKKNDEIID